MNKNLKLKKKLPNRNFSKRERKGMIAFINILGNQLNWAFYKIRPIEKN